MFKKSLSFVIFGVLILSSLACSLSQCAQQPQNTERAESEPQEIAPTEIIPDETQETNHPGYILYSDPNGLYLLDLENFQSQQLVTGDISGGEISPDGQYLAYFEVSPDPNNWQYHKLRVMDIDTGVQLDVSSVPEDINTFAWSTFPGQITYTRRNWDYCSEFIDHQITGIYQINVLNNETTTLHIGTDQYVFWVEKWSPEGRYLLFSHGPDCSEGRSLMYYDSQTGDVDGIPFAEASWSPKGNYLAAHEFWYWDPEELPLMQYQIPTGEQQELFFEPGYYASNPVWSPDGEWLAFTISTVEGNQSEPMLLNMSTGETNTIPLLNALPDFWNPASDSLILSIRTEDNNRDIYLYHLDSGTVDRIFNGLFGYALQWIQ